MLIARAKALKEWVWRPALVCAAIALALLLLAAPAHAAFPGKNGTIAFWSSRSPMGIYTMNADGTAQTLVADNDANNPAWSPDGQRIAFTRFGNIWVMNADGTGQSLITGGNNTDNTPHWSPDGQRIVFARGQDGHAWVVNPDGTGLTQVNTGQVGVSETAWSPNGQMIAFIGESPGTSGLYVMAPDGSGLRSLLLDTFGATHLHPEWSPSGDKIAVIENSCTSSGCCQFGCDFGRLIMVGLDGSVQDFGPNPIQGGYPAWSPDGQKIVFDDETSSCVPCGGSNREIFTMNLDGSNRTRITSNAIPNDPYGSGPADIRTDWQPIPINGYPRPKGATPFQTYLTVAYKPCASPNEQHGAPLAVLSCSPPQQASDFLTVGTLDANGQAANSVGSVRYDVKPGTAANPGDDADVKMVISIKDVRLKDLSDYAGQLQITSSRRITDKLSTPAPDGTTQAATTQDTPFSTTVPCAPTTSDTTIGSLCAISTTADAVVPGQVAEGARSNWELGQVKVYDGGSDQDADTTADNTLFMDQGIFVP